MGVWIISESYVGRTRPLVAIRSDSDQWPEWELALVRRELGIPDRVALVLNRWQQARADTQDLPLLRYPFGPASALWPTAVQPLLGPPRLTRVEIGRWMNPNA